MDELQTRIVAHHVGGRGHGVAFNPPSMFNDDVVHVIYEADAASAEEMIRTSNAQVPNHLGRHIFPYCLGRAKGFGKLHITANAYASSLLRPDPSFLKKYCCEMRIEPAVYDVTYDDMLKIVKEVEVEIHTLDILFAEGKLPDLLLPDFLSLDTQGSELDILSGSKGVIAQSVLGILTEVEMVSMYAGQPLLGDILERMNTFGFHFAGFTHQYEITDFRAPIGLRGRSFPGFGDALFLRSIDNLPNCNWSADQLFLKFAKLAFISLMFGYVENALKALEVMNSYCSASTEQLINLLKERHYWKFLQEIQTATQAVEEVYPPLFGIPTWSKPADTSISTVSWSDVYHSEAVRQCDLASMEIPSAPNLRIRLRTWSVEFAGSLRRLFIEEPSRSQERLRSLVLNNPGKALAKGIYYFLRSLNLIPEQLSEPVKPVVEKSPQNIIKRYGINQGYSAFETVLFNNGFTVVADLVRQKRIAAECFVRPLTSELRTGVGWTRPYPVQQRTKIHKGDHARGLIQNTLPERPSVSSDPATTIR